MFSGDYMMSQQFQFLMVRLKAKSEENNEFIITMFQFLMVRLKDEKAKPFFTYSQFQFLMVRLKERERR